MIDANKDKQHERDHKDAEKLRQYQKENWISIPRADFDAMRNELKETRKDAEKHQMLVYLCKEFGFDPEYIVNTTNIYKKIVERLKKRIEDTKELTTFNQYLNAELQKILEGKD